MREVSCKFPNLGPGSVSYFEIGLLDLLLCGVESLVGGLSKMRVDVCMSKKGKEKGPRSRKFFFLFLVSQT